MKSHVYPETFFKISHFDKAMQIYSQNPASDYWVRSEGVKKLVEILFRVTEFELGPWQLQ